MRHNWKHTLYLYVDQHNRIEVEDRYCAISAPITDMNYVMKRSERARRLKSWYQARGTHPVKSETKAKLLRAREGEGEVIVDVELHIQRVCEQQGASLSDERIERECVTLVREGDGWVIGRVEMLVLEQGGKRLKGGTRACAARKTRSTPFLNREVIGRMQSVRAVPYHRDKAIQYAEQWWNEANPHFLVFEVDCTNFVSQCLFAGGAPMNYTGRRETGWWYRGMVSGQEGWSFSWAVADSSRLYLENSTSGLRATRVSHAADLQLGDVIVYDWNGNGQYQHQTIVTAFDGNGMPLVNAHTMNSRHRYWDYQDSHAWTEATQHRFFHIADVF